MRIRKTLAKALGQLRPSASYSSDHETWIPSSFSNSSAGGSQGLFCHLNQSPWDVHPNRRFWRSSFKCFEGVKSPPNPIEELEKLSGEILEHGKDVSRKVPTEMKSEVHKRVNTHSRNKKNVDTVNKSNNGIVMCKKNDGRKWFCKRPAKLPHTLCEHHFSLSRSYKRHVPSGSVVGCNSENQNESKNLNSEYYYYSTVSPSGGMRRSARNANGINTMQIMEVKMEKDVINGKEDGVEVLDYKKGSGSNSKEKLKTGAKRGRELAKYRSLESFLVADQPNSSTAE